MDNIPFLTLSGDLSKQYKLSKYNIYINRNNRLVFNARSGAVIAFNSEELRSDEADVLRSCKMIVERDVDELSELEAVYNQRESNHHLLHLILATTTSCNFRCVYCYEHHANTSMSDSIMENIESLVEQNARAGNDISIVWYGGEPLLGFDSLLSLSRRFIGICEKSGVTYHSEMITNGYLFDAEKIQKLHEMRISNVQITLDGVAEVHNKRRTLLNGQPSFQRIFENVRKIYDSGVSITVRINVDKLNIASAYQLVDIFSSFGMFSLDFTLGMLKEFDFVNAKYDKMNLFSMKDFADEFLKFRNYLHQHGFRRAVLKMYPKPKLNCCTLDGPNTYVIGPNGDFYKCIAHVGNKSHSIGNILNYTDEESAYRNFSPFGIKKCRVCRYLPVCKGGCLYNSYTNSFEQCDVWKYITEKLIEQVYLETTQ